MPKSTAFAHAHLLQIFNAIPIANLADNAASSPATTLTVALHHADPLAGGNQAAQEVVYPGYARVTLARTSAGWVVTDNVVSPAVPIEFPAMTSGTGDTATHWSVGTGVGNNLMYRGTLEPVVVITVGIAPKVTTSSTLTELV